MTGTRETLVTGHVIGRRLADILTVDLRWQLLGPPIHHATANMVLHPVETLFREVHEE